MRAAVSRMPTTSKGTRYSREDRVADVGGVGSGDHELVAGDVVELGQQLVALVAAGVLLDPVFDRAATAHGDLIDRDAGRVGQLVDLSGDEDDARVVGELVVAEDVDQHRAQDAGDGDGHDERGHRARCR